ncbi:MAG: hypothetical protein HY901_04880, partial [Deltaproteobacteria bacterium]|nr:hypothetical protein [Deltaproteobacteria bacterium]
LAGDERACGGTINETLRDFCSLSVGKCTCEDVVTGDEKACGHIPRELKNFCSAPTRMAIAIGEEDGRIGRRVK